MAVRNMVKAQFQSGHDSWVKDETLVRDRPVTASEACNVLDNLQRAIEGRSSDKDVRVEAARKISEIKGQIRGSSHGITGRGFSQNLFSKPFTSGGTAYRVDFELSGEIKG